MNEKTTQRLVIFDDGSFLVTYCTYTDREVEMYFSGSKIVAVYHVT